MDDVRAPPDLQQPPEIPEVPRRIRLYRHQWIGVGVMILIPIVALLGLFGETRGEAGAEAGEIRMEVEYPEALRKAAGSGSHHPIPSSTPLECFRGFNRAMDRRVIPRAARDPYR